MRTTLADSLKILVCLVMASLGVFFFNRIAHGQLFLFSLPWELPPSASELRNAKELGEWLLLSPIPISAGIWLFLTYCSFRPFDGLSRMNSVGITLVSLQVLAIVATALDCWSTVLLVSRFGIEGEVHPGIASFSYMFGRTTGTVFGKLFQWVCMQFIIAAVSIRWRIVVLAVFILAGMLASLWNFGQAMEFMIVE